MKTFEFSIIASGLDPEAEGFEDRFFEAGCDDATISFQKGRIILDFSRDADSLASAIASAVENVGEAGATVDHIEPDPLVSLSDIAVRTHMSKSAISLYHKGERGKEFPAPVARVTSESPMWDWPTVARWMYKNGRIEKEVAVEAEVVKRANEAIRDGNKHIEDRLTKAALAYERQLEAA